MTLRSPPPPSIGARARARFAALRTTDLIVIAFAAGYALLAVAGARTWAGALALSYVLYLVIGVATVAQTARTAHRSPAGRVRLGWVLLALAVAARLIGGVVWSAHDHPIGEEPGWLIALQLSYLGFVLPALLVFPSAVWRGRDALRARIDVSTVLIGSALVTWFLAIGPLLRSPRLASAPLDDRLYAFGDSIAVVLAAVLHLRSTLPSVRRGAHWLLAAYLLRLIPDLVIWQSGSTPDFSPFGTIDTAWSLAWALQWAAARAGEPEAAAHPEHTASGAEPARRDRYRSGAIPLMFLVAALAVLLRAMVAGDSAEAAFFATGSAVLTLLLVARQGVEFDERDRLTQRLEWERARFRALLHHAYDAVALLGSRGTLRYASPSTIRMFGDHLGGLAPEQIVELVHPDDRAGIVAAFTAEHTPTRAVRIRARDRDGQWRTFDGHLADHRDDPDVRGIVLHGIDRTRERKLTEGLEHTQPLEALGVLAGGLAHDLNNILTVVASHAELLESEPGLDARTNADVAGIAAASDRARSLTRGLLTLSRRKDVGAAVLDCATVVRDRLHGPRPVPLVVAPGILAQVRATPEALVQVIDALLEVGRDEARGREVDVRVDERSVDEAGAIAWHVEARRYVALSVGTGPVDGPAAEAEEAVRTIAGEEWDLAPGDLALLIALAACRETGGTVVRERRGDHTRLIALVPAVHQ